MQFHDMYRLISVLWEAWTWLSLAPREALKSTVHYYSPSIYHLWEMSAGILRMTTQMMTNYQIDKPDYHKVSDKYANNLHYITLIE